jgi:hypothetical protein
MWKDPIVEETRRWRKEYASQFDSLEAMYQDLKKAEAEHPELVVSFFPPEQKRERPTKRRAS